MTYKTWDFRGVSKSDFEGEYFKGSSRGSLRRTLRGTWSKTLRRTLRGIPKGTSGGLHTGHGRGLVVKLRSGLIQDDLFLFLKFK